MSDDTYPNVPQTVEGLAYRIRDFHRRLQILEAELDRYELPVIEERLRNLSQDVRSLKTAFYTFAFSAVGAAILFAFSVFALLGK